MEYPWCTPRVSLLHNQAHYRRVSPKVAQVVAPYRALVQPNRILCSFRILNRHSLYGSDRHTYTYTAIGNCTDLFMRGVLLHLYMASAYHPLSKGSVQPQYLPCYRWAQYQLTIRTFLTPMLVRQYETNVTMNPILRKGYRKTVYYQGLGSTSALPLPCMVEEATIPQSRDMVVY